MGPTVAGVLIGRDGSCSARLFGTPQPALGMRHGGARLLRELLDQHRGNLAVTLASYNAGPGAVASHGGAVPPFAETRNYVKRVTHLIADAHNAGGDLTAVGQPVG